MNEMTNLALLIWCAACSLWIVMISFGIFNILKREKEKDVKQKKR